MEQEKQQETSYEEQDLIIFQEGLFGFEEYRKFLPVSAEENSDSVIYLQSVEEEHLCFLAMNPFLLKDDYSPQLPEADRKALNPDKEEDLSYYVLCVLKEPAEESTVNLKCPLVVNAITRQARQVVLDSDQYDLRHTLKEFSDKEGA